MTSNGAGGATALATLKNYVAGEWRQPASTASREVVNPATGEPISVVPISGPEDLDAAVASARGSLPSWRATATSSRVAHLFALRELMRQRQDDLARSITTEMGKTLGDAAAEVGRAIEMVECATAATTTMQGRNLENVARNVDCETVRQPVGVCAAIVPFNFPLMVPFWFLPFAIATGNCFVLKPSEVVPNTMNLAFELLEEAGVPAGVANLVNGDKTVAEGILDHPGIDAVSFVGSAPVARHVYSRAAANGKRVQALGGAKNFMVVMPDCDLDRTVAGLIGSAFGAAGQRCMAGSVVVAVGDVYERLLAALTEATEAIAVGNGLDAEVEMGPVVSGAACWGIEGWIERGVEEGARAALDGRGNVRGAGSFVGPTILDGVRPEMAVAQEEIFGPVLCLMRADDLGEAIEMVNGSRFGNGTSIFTESGAAVRRYRHDVEAGMIGVNIGVAAPVAFFPFSGWKESFFGDLHAHGPDAVDFYTRKKTVTTRYFSQQPTGSFFTDK